MTLPLDDSIYIFINTDSDKLIETALQKRKDIIVVERKDELANDVVGKIEAIRDGFLQVEKFISINFDFVIDLDLTSPFRTVSDLEGIIQTYKNDLRKDLIISVVKSRRNPFFNMVQDINGEISLVNSSEFTSRQQAPDVYDINGSMYLYKPEFLRNKSYLFDGRCGIYIMNDYRVLDIDDQEDYEWMEMISPYLRKRYPGIKEIYEC
ncbi:acylneuraminate cytidylyltransferase family protein [Enterococcus gallinarum]|uniref:acylneuraminate cytidylyltransferase family protein n=1 Tax=Enterococcus gallinarum TaxID=1353 RepID=UPI002433BF13|nr:acylneuraminate cytidylyltransferase family protein [Enterococcus gallinarum]